MQGEERGWCGVVRSTRSRKCHMNGMKLFLCSSHARIQTRSNSMSHARLCHRGCGSSAPAGARAHLSAPFPPNTHPSALSFPFPTPPLPFSSSLLFLFPFSCVPVPHSLSLTTFTMRLFTIALSLVALGVATSSASTEPVGRDFARKMEVRDPRKSHHSGRSEKLFTDCTLSEWHRQLNLAQHFCIGSRTFLLTHSLVRRWPAERSSLRWKGAQQARPRRGRQVGWGFQVW